MKLTELANILAKRVYEVINQETQPILTDNQMAKYGRKLEPGCIALRVLVVADENAGELGRMELFVPIRKNALKNAPDSALAAALEYIATLANYRATMISRARQRIAAN